MMKKNIVVLLILALLGLGGVIATAQSGWGGTGWISSQATVSSSDLKGNLDYLYDVKAPNPGNCHGEERVLGVTGDGWTCVQKNQPDSCIFNGNTITSGDAVTAYRTDTVPFGENCLSERRTCTNGVLSGTYQSSSCTVVEAGACSFNGNSIAHGDSVTAYGAYSVPYGSTCSSQQRTCSNGILSGTYQAASCSVVAPSSCAFGTSSVSNGESVTAYELATVPFGSTCQSESRSCTNGVLSGSFEEAACVVAPAATCVFDGAEVADGTSVTAYVAETVPYGSSCATETRTCSDGTLSGSYEATSCTVSRQDPVTFRQQDFITSTTQYYCWTPSIWDGVGGTESPRDANNQCPGILSVERTRTVRALMNHPGIRYGSGSTGIGHDGLASDAGTLQQLCLIKGYRHVVGHATREGRSGFREFTSPGNNRLVYGQSGQRFVNSRVTINQTFNGDRGYVICSDTASGSGGSGGGSGGGGGNPTDTVREINVF